jgi:hypothetical protein
MIKNMHFPQVENLSTLWSTVKQAIKFAPHIYFPLYTVGISILAYTLDSNTIFNLTKDLPYQLTVAIIAIGLTYVMINRDITRWKKTRNMADRKHMIVLIIFMFTSLYVETIFFVINNIPNGIVVPNETHIEATKIKIISLLVNSFIWKNPFIP